MSNLTTIAKLVARNNPEAFREAEQLCAPMLLPRHSKLIPEIHKAIKDQFPELDRTDESILFAACVYQAWAPATLIAPKIERLPNGIRPVMCEVMSWNNATVVNHYSDQSRSYVKGAAGIEFNKKISSVLLGFEKFSVKSNQLSLL